MTNQEQVFSKACCIVAAFVGFLAASACGQQVLSPHSMPVIGHVDPRYVSFNVEAVEVTGGRFWKPFPRTDQGGARASAEQVPQANSAANNDPYQYRAPIDLGNPKLRRLALALSPAYVRVSGTWRNSTYFQDNDEPALQTVPEGFKNVMTRAEWKGVVDFARSTKAEIVTSVAFSDGTRDPNGVWTPGQAKSFFQYTKSIGGRIAATEFMNEPTFAAVGGAPKGYDAAAFARDVKAFRTFLHSESPKTVFLGPGSIGEGPPMVDGLPLPKMISSEEMLKATGPAFDAFSYHFYTTLSKRCVGNNGLSWEKVLTPLYLDRNLEAEAFYAGLRDKYLPGKPLWLTETGEAGCGGNPWAADFVDAFRFADQLGALAQKSVQTVIVNTLASSDYGLLDEDTLNPRPDYWVALLWKRLMGTQVLDPGPKNGSELHVYAQCLRGAKGGVSLEVLNLDQQALHTLSFPLPSEHYTLTAPTLLSSQTLLNGVPLVAGSDGTIPALSSAREPAGELAFPPASITFVTFPQAKNAACSTNRGHGEGS